MTSKQETFDLVARHLLAQMRQSKDSTKDNCAYRGKDGHGNPNGLMCALGCLIPKHKYVPEMEGDTVFMSIGNQSSLVGPVLKEEGHDLDLCDRLQIVHDEYPPSMWREMLIDTATMFGLEMKV